MVMDERKEGMERRKGKEKDRNAPEACLPSFAATVACASVVFAAKVHTTLELKHLPFQHGGRQQPSPVQTEKRPEVQRYLVDCGHQVAARPSLRTAHVPDIRLIRIDAVTSLCRADLLIP